MLVKVPQLKLVKVIGMLKGDILNLAVIADKILLKSTSIAILYSLRSVYFKIII